MRQTVYIFCVCLGLLTGCSPTDFVEGELDTEVMRFEQADSSVKAVDSRAFIYDIGRRPNYLRDKGIRKAAIAYATYLDSARMRQAGLVCGIPGRDYDSLARVAGAEVTRLVALDTMETDDHGFLVLQEIDYKKREAETEDVMTQRFLSYFGPEGFSAKWSKAVPFGRTELEEMMRQAQTGYYEMKEWQYAPPGSYLFPLLFLIAIAIFVVKRKRKVRQRAMLQRQEAEAARQAREKAEAAERWKCQLASRELEYGPLTKRICIDEQEDKDIYVYESKRVIFIRGKKVDFDDILSCSVEQLVYEKGEAVQVTQPDAADMLMQQILFGAGKRYNVKSTSKIKAAPDKYKYQVSIGLRSISEPQIFVTLFNGEVANELKNLIHAIISNK